MIIAIPNILGTMSSSKKESLKDYAMKSFSEAQKLYESELLSNIKPGSGNSDFRDIGGYGYYITLSELENRQNKYKGCVLFKKINSDDAKYYMFIYITDGEYMYSAKGQTEIKSIEPENNTLPANEYEIINNIEEPTIPEESIESGWIEEETTY